MPMPQGLGNTLVRAQPQQQPQMPQQQGIAAYIANMKAFDPSMPTVREAPQTSIFDNIPGFGNILQMLLASKAAPDPAMDSKLRNSVGNMAINNQRHREWLDNWDRERIAAQRMNQMGQQ